jgi:hypothetical protein
MLKKSPSATPKIGQELYLKGRVSAVNTEIENFPRVTIKLNRYDYPITLVWYEPDRDDSVLLAS